MLHLSRENADKALEAWNRIDYMDGRCRAGDMDLIEDFLKLCYTELPDQKKLDYEVDKGVCHHCGALIPCD